jgi:hypothetical protein
MTISEPRIRLTAKQGLHIPEKPLLLKGACRKISNQIVVIIQLIGD